MQFRERLGQGLPPEQALPRAASEVGPFMAVCATTVSIGFFAFVPTPFTGIAELGLISGVGMFISLVVTLTLLPALIRVMPPAAEQVKLRPPDEGALARVLDWPYRRARAIWIGAAVVAMLALTLVPRARFDSDPIKLRDPNSEAVKTFRELLRDPNVPTLTLSVLAPDEAQARAIADRLGQLPEVRRALTLWDLVPQDQDAKLAMLGELALNLALQPVPNIPDPASTRADDLRTMRALAQSLPAYVERSRDAQREAGARLLAALRRLDAQLDQQDPATQLQTLTRLREALLGSLPAQLEDLTTALNAGKVTEADLPAPLQHRWRGIDGRYRVEIWPREVLDNQAATARFVDAVHRVAPDAAGPPVDTLESGRAVVSAFKQAFLYSFVAISLLLLVLLRSFKDTLLVLVPLVLAGLLTVATLVLLGIPFNFANVIALPLVLGVGVDYGVYLVQRGRAAGAPANILHTSTARAVLFGALITMANFGNLMLARHPGMVGMGLLLTVGLGMTLLCALVLLPSLLAPRTQARRDRAAAGVDDQ
jgi:hopanoid biosynthesis associated RND transporter like protein HpnN